MAVRKKIDVAALRKILDDAERVLGSPIVRTLILPILPTWGLTPAQIAQLETRHADYGARKARARKRAASRGAAVLLAVALGAAGCAASVATHARRTPLPEAGYVQTPGDHMAPALADLKARLEAHGFVIEPLAAHVQSAGVVNAASKRIGLHPSLGVNGQLEVLAHEAGHVLLPYFAGPQAEIMAELVSVEVCRRYGMDTRRAAGRYLAPYRQEIAEVQRWWGADIRYVAEVLTGARPWPQ